MQSIKVIISGGGTGGHIFPAIAIANALKKKDENIDILFVGAKGKMEMEKVPAAGFRIEGLWISGLQRRLTLKNILFPVKLIISVLKAKKILNQFKPDIVIGTGGYASGPMLYMATRKNIPTLIQEQNSFPGITNKLLAKKVNRICVAYDGMEKFFPKEKLIITGNPVRKDVLQIEGKETKGLEYFGLSSNKKTLLVIGGSLGARTINESIHHALDVLIKNNIQVVWQTGKNYFPIAKQRVDSKTESRIKVCKFIERMDYAYSVADLVVSRAGAISVSELCNIGKPTILIPSPNVAEDHQTKNAIALVKQKAAILVKDKDAIKTLLPVIIGLINNEEERNTLQNNISKLGLKDSAERIADEVLGLINP